MRVHMLCRWSMTGPVCAGHWERRLQAQLGGRPHARALLDEPRPRARLPEVHRERHRLWLRGSAFRPVSPRSCCSSRVLIHYLRHAKTLWLWLPT